MNTELEQRPRPRPAQRVKAPAGIVTCSLCLRVLRDSEWIEAERVIRESRSFDHASPPRMVSAVCDPCTGAILSRRAKARGLGAA
jgi:hypothetical protein